jgi:hypothetical protein
MLSATISNIQALILTLEAAEVEAVKVGVEKEQEVEIEAEMVLNRVSREPYTEYPSC